MKTLFVILISIFVLCCGMPSNNMLSNKMMNELSTQNLELLPRKEELKNLCKSISVLEAILCPEWEYRYYSYNNNWSEEEEVFEMRDGQGDQMLILFNKNGVVINGFAHESIMRNWKGIRENIPDEFKEFIFGEPVKSIGTTFCIWQTKSDRKWQVGDINFPENNYLDGSKDLLKILDGKPDTYKNWAIEYYELDELSIELVEKVYNHKLLTKELINKMNPKLSDIDKLESDLKEIGYKYEL